MSDITIEVPNLSRSFWTWEVFFGAPKSLVLKLSVAGDESTNADGTIGFLMLGGIEWIALPTLFRHKAPVYYTRTTDGLATVSFGEPDRRREVICKSIEWYIL